MADASFEAEEHFDEYEHYNYDQDKAMLSGHSGKKENLAFQNYSIE